MYLNWSALRWPVYSSLGQFCSGPWLHVLDAFGQRTLGIKLALCAEGWHILHPWIYNFAESHRVDGAEEI
jgi:hypothetical protein